jgi:hypothetical protein
VREPDGVGEPLEAALVQRLVQLVEHAHRGGRVAEDGGARR